MVFPVNRSDECTLPTQKKKKSHSISSHLFPWGHNSRQGQRQGSVRWSLRHEARQAREGQQGRLHGNLRESYSGKSIWANPKAATEHPPLQGSTSFCPAGNLPYVSISDIPHPSQLSSSLSPAALTSTGSHHPRLMHRGDPRSPKRLAEGTITLKSPGDDNWPPHVPRWPMATGRGAEPGAGCSLRGRQGTSCR